MEKFTVHILGCGSALPTMRHMNTSQVVSIRNKSFMLDCGEGTQLAIRKHNINFNKIATIFISHLHGDHCLGLPGLISSMGLLGRKSPLQIYGPSDTELLFRPMIDFLCPNLEYEIVFHKIDTTRHELVYEDRSLTVHSLPMKHRIPCCGYLFKEKAGLRHILPYMMERHEIPYSQVNNIKNGMDFVTKDGRVIANDELTTPPDTPRSYAFCSDTMYDESIIPYIKEVDLLYHEATYGDDKQDLATKYFHSTARQAAQVAKASGAKGLIIGHYSQRYNDEHTLLQEAQSVFPNTKLSNEGMVYEITNK